MEGRNVIFEVLMWNITEKKIENRSFIAKIIKKSYTPISQLINGWCSTFDVMNDQFGKQGKAYNNETVIK